MRDWLIKKRKNKGFTQAQVAKRSGISRSYYSEIETGEKTPGGMTAKRISEVLNFDMSLFFDERRDSRQLNLPNWHTELKKSVRG